MTISEEYDDYLKSDDWKSKRQDVLKRDGYKCVKCGSEEKLEVHHLSYKNTKKRAEYLTELCTLCDYCHNLTHKLSYDNLGFIIEKRKDSFYYSDDINKMPNEIIGLGEENKIILDRLYQSLIKVYKKYNHKISQYCDRNILLNRGKNQLEQIHKKVKINEKEYRGFKDLYVEILQKVKETPIGEKISCSIETENNKVNYSKPNIEILDYLTCSGQGLIRRNFRKSIVNNDKGESKDVRGVEYIKTENNPCPFFNPYVKIKKCPNCERRFDYRSDYCYECRYIKGSKKGQRYRLVQMQNRPPFCECVKFKLIDKEEIKQEGTTEIIEDNKIEIIPKYLDEDKCQVLLDSYSKGGSKRSPKHEGET